MAAKNIRFATEARDAKAHALAGLDPAVADSVALKALFNLAEEWSLTREQPVHLLGKPSQRT